MVFLSPGVYTTILDYSLYIPNLSQTIVGVVGMASKGPINEATYVTNVLSFITKFGQPNPAYMGPYAALQSLRFARQLYYVRVAGPSAAESSVDVIESTTAAAVVSGAAGPFKIVSADNNVLRLKINDDANWLVVTLTKGVRTAAQVASDIQTAIDGGAGNKDVVVTATAAGKIQLLSETLGATSAVKIDSVANGSSANAVLGFATAGEQSIGSAAVAGVATGAGVTQPYTIQNGDTLLISIDGDAAVEVALTPGSVSAADLATEIDTALGAAATVSAETVSGNVVVRITSATTGATSSVLVADTAAARTLGFDVALHKGTDATAARKVSTIAGDYAIGANNVLKVRFNGGTSRSIALTPGVLTATAAAAAINTVIGTDGYNEGVATVLTDNKLKISSLAVGATASVQIDNTGSGQYAFNFATSAANGTGASGVTFTVSALTKGTHGDKLKVVASAGQNASTFKLRIYDGDALVETWDNLVKTPTDANFIETRINDVSTWITVTDNPAVTNFPPYSVTYTLTGGNDGISDVTDADYIGQVNAGSKTGMQLFANQEDFDLNLLLVPGISSPAVINEMLLLCSVRGDAMCIADPPFGLSVQQVVDWHNGYGAYSDHQAFNSMYGALYWPWLQIYDSVNKQTVWVPPSGFVSGVYAYTDYTTETWFAPAGHNRGHLLQPLRLEYSPDLGERDLLYGNQNAVNPIVNFKKDGITVWGQRTLQRKPSALDRVNVVRMILYLRKVIATATQYLTFEPSDPVTWATFVNLVEPYLESVKQRRGLVEYKVICDKSTNPDDALDRNEMHAVVALKPTKTAEFIEIKFVVVNQGAKFEDLTY